MTQPDPALRSRQPDPEPYELCRWVTIALRFGVNSVQDGAVAEGHIEGCAWCNIKSKLLDLTYVPPEVS